MDPEKLFFILLLILEIVTFVFADRFLWRRENNMFINVLKAVVLTVVFALCFICVSIVIYLFECGEGSLLLAIGALWCIFCLGDLMFILEELD